MTSDEVKARLWEAYKAGIKHCNGKNGKMIPDRHKSYFDMWLIEEMPEVANAEEPYFDKAAENGIDRQQWYSKYMQQVKQVGPFKLPHNVCGICLMPDCICPSEV